MEFDKKEIAAVQLAINENECQLEELSMLQLTLVGGGVGEVIFG